MINFKKLGLSFLFLVMLLKSNSLKHDSLEMGEGVYSQFRTPVPNTTSLSHMSKALQSKQVLTGAKPIANETSFMAPIHSDFTEQKKMDFRNLVAVFFAPDFEKLSRSKLLSIFRVLEVKFEPVDMRIQSSLARMIDRGTGLTTRVSSVFIRTVKDTTDQNYYEQIGFKMQGGDEAFSFAREVLLLGLGKSHPNFKIDKRDRYFEQYELENNVTVKLAWFPHAERQVEGEFIASEPSPANPGVVALDLFFGSSH